MVMFSDAIDKLKREYTDKYVVVDAARPELARFRDITGRVKTVNMSGRALVEFDDYHLNTGWYDIDTSYLKVVDKPLPKVEKPKAEKKAPAPRAEVKPQAAAKAPAASGAGKMSVAEMVAAARAGKGGTAAPTKPAESKAKAEAPAAPQAAKPATPAAGGKMSVAEMLAAARAGKGGAATAAPEAKPQAKAAPVEEAEPEAETAPAQAPTAAAAAGDETPPRYRVDRTKMSVAEMIAYCRKVDAR